MMKSAWDLPRARYLCYCPGEQNSKDAQAWGDRLVTCTQMACLQSFLAGSHLASSTRGNDAAPGTESSSSEGRRANTCSGFSTTCHRVPALTLPFWKPALAILR